LYAFAEFSGPQPPNIVAVYSNNENGRRRDQSRLQLFSVADGSELRCNSCQGEIGPALGKVIRSYWYEDKHFVVHTRNTNSPTTVQLFWVVSVEGGDFMVRKVREIQLLNPKTRVSTPQMSDDGAELAWTICDERCELFQLNLKTTEEIKSAIVCPVGTRPKAIWMGTEASFECK
jgi:hypothetical protein